MGTGCATSLEPPEISVCPIPRSDASRLPQSARAGMVPWLMKSLLLLALGGIAGVLATVLFFTVDPTFNSNDANGAGGGNITLELSEDALAKLVADERANLPAFGDHPQVQVTVGTNGLMKV